MMQYKAEPDLSEADTGKKLPPRTPCICRDVWCGNWKSHHFYLNNKFKNRSLNTKSCEEVLDIPYLEYTTVHYWSGPELFLEYISKTQNKTTESL